MSSSSNSATTSAAAAVVREAEYPQAPERVWDALTDPDALSEWLMPATDFAPERGRRFRLHPSPDAADAVECQVTEAEPARRRSYTWRAAASGRPAGRVTWTLTPTERGGTRLRIVHEPVVTGPAACSFAVARRPQPTRHLDMHTPITRLTAVLITGGTNP